MPKTLGAIKEVETIIQRYGAFKKVLPLNGRVSTSNSTSILIKHNLIFINDKLVRLFFSHNIFAEKQEKQCSDYKLIFCLYLPVCLFFLLSIIKGKCEILADCCNIVLFCFNLRLFLKWRMLLPLGLSSLASSRFVVWSRTVPLASN